MNSLTITTILSVFATTVFGQVTPAFKDSAIRDVLHTLTTNYVFRKPPKGQKTMYSRKNWPVFMKN